MSFLTQAPCTWCSHARSLHVGAAALEGGAAKITGCMAHSCPCPGFVGAPAAVVCAWCKDTIREGDRSLAVSHGICPPCAESVRRADPTPPVVV